MIIYIAYKERLLTEINATDRSRMKKKVNGYFMIYMSITSLHYRARRRRIISRKYRIFISSLWTTKIYEK